MPFAGTFLTMPLVIRMPLFAFFTPAMLDQAFWFNRAPAAMSASLVGGIVAFFGWFLLMAAALAVLSRGSRKANPLRADAYRRFASLLFWSGLLGWLVLFCTYEQVPFFGMRFWFLMVAVLFLAWLARIVWYLSRDYPRRRKEMQERERFTKYLA